MGWTKKRGRQQGFTFIELMVSVTILTIVVGVVVEGLTKLMQRNTTETSKTDLTQESREFMDQVVNDIHQSGYPSVKMFDPARALYRYRPRIPQIATSTCRIRVRASQCDAKFPAVRGRCGRKRHGQ